MAEKRVIELEVKLGASKKAIDDLTKSTTDLSASFEDVYGEMQPLSGRMGELEDRLYELALAGKQNTQEYKDLQAEIAKFKKVIAETDASVDSASGTMSQKLGGALGGITSAFELGQGAMMSFGVESQEVEEALLKVQSAMAISQGVQGIKEAIPSFKALGTTATNAFQNMTAAGKAFAVTGIGLLITGLSLVITYWDDIKKAVGGVSEEEQKLAAYRRQYAAEQDKQVAEESKGFATLIAQLKASNKGSKERSELITEINKKYGTTLKNLSDEAEFQNQLNKELENYLTYQQAKFRLQKNEEAIVRNLETQSRLKRELVQAEKDLTKAIADGAGKTKRTLEDGVLTTINVNEAATIAREKAAETIRTNTKALEEAEDRFENYGKAAIYASGQIDKLTYSGKRYVEQNEETTKSTNKVTKEIKDQSSTTRDTNQEMLDAGEAFAEAAKKRRDKTEQEVKDSEQAKNEASRYWQNLDLDFTLKTEEEKQQARQKTVDLALKTAQTFGQVYAELNNLLNASDNERLKSVKKGSAEENKIKKQMFERDKKLRIVQTIIDTASNVVTSVRNGGGIPTGIPFGVAAGVMGALQIAAISKTKFEGSTGGGGGDTAVPQVAGAGGVMAPNFNLVGNAQATNPLAGLGEGIIQAYVVSGDVTTAQSLDRNRVNNATFG
jgi:uncharacterized coiled-coil protein SlyX